MGTNKKKTTTIVEGNKTIKDITNFNFLNGLRLKIVLVIAITLIISAPISQFLDNLIMKTGITTSGLGAYINSLISILVTTFIMLIFINRMVLKPIKSHLNLLNLISLGDLSNDVEVHGKDEISQLNKASNVMLQNLRQLVEDIKEIAGEANDLSTEIEKTVKEVAVSIEEVASSTQDVAQGSETQNNAMTEAVQKLEQLNAIIDVASKQATETKDVSRKTYQSAVKGGQAARETNEKMNIIETTSDEVAGTVQELKNYSNRIGEITETISNIAEQTNLLALNAAIEAARAGEQGKGFAVVAEEVRKLAEGSATATEEIASIVRDVQNKTTEAANEINKNVEAVSEGKEAVRNTEEALEEIENEVNKTAEQIDIIYVNIEKQVKYSDDTKDLIESVTEVSQSNSAASQEVAASTEEQSATIEQVLTSVQNLSKIAERIDTHMGRFKV